MKEYLVRVNLDGSIAYLKEIDGDVDGVKHLEDVMLAAFAEQRDEINALRARVCDTKPHDDPCHHTEMCRVCVPNRVAEKTEPSAIMFEEEYCKMPYPAEDMMDPDRPTTLLAVLKVDRSQLSRVD